MDSQEVLDKAFRRVKKIEVRNLKKVSDVRAESISRVSAFSHTLESQLEKYVKAFPNMDGLPEFHYALIDLQIGMDRLRHSLGAVHWASETTGRLLKEYVAKLKRGTNRVQLERTRKSAYGRLSSVVKKVDGDLKVLQDARAAFKNIPAIDTEQPVVVIAGPPNVGKSNIIEKLTTARPKIAPYPFTTQGISIGHMEHGYRRIQFVDTPGLLDRPLEERNDIEKHAILAIELIADIIVFVFDPSETCGYRMEAQENLHLAIAQAFPDIPMMTIANKCDIMAPEKGSAENYEASVSALEGVGIEELRAMILERMDSLTA